MLKPLLLRESRCTAQGRNSEAAQRKIQDSARTQNPTKPGKENATDHGN